MASLEKKGKKKSSLFARRRLEEADEDTAEGVEDVAAAQGRGGGQSRERRPQEQRARTMQLNFSQAMEDFERMFPGMDRAVIESVLRANNGVVDATIDQLLTMSSDNIDGGADDSSDSDDDIDLYDADHNRLRSGHYPDQDDYSDDDEAPPGYTVDPPTYPSPFTSAAPTIPPRQPIGKPSSAVTSTSSPAYRRWSPPLIGELPRDFLRITQPASLAHQAVPPPPPPYRYEHDQHHHQIFSAPEEHRPMAAVPPMKKSWWSRSSKSGGGKGLSGATSDELRLPSPRQVPPTSSEVLRQIGENEKKILMIERQKSIDQGKASKSSLQVLDDEVFALYLQNQEFLQMLRQNDEFMETLNRNHGPSHSGGGGQRINIFPGGGEGMRNRTISSGSDGVGDNEDGLRSFPDGMPLPKDEDAELKAKLKEMDQPSRRMFLKLANMFYNYKKKKPKNILGDDGGPATACLLEPEDEEDERQTRGMSPEEEDDDGGKKEEVVGAVGGLDYETRQRPQGSVDAVSSYPYQRERMNML